jgi:hypothetical protein
MRSVITGASGALALGLVLVVATAAPAASRNWAACGKALTTSAGGQAGVPARLDGDPKLQSVFGDTAPSSELKVSRSLCADYDADGDIDRAALYDCCTVSSPSPVVILRNEGGGDYAIAYARLNDAVFFLRTAGRDLVARSPKYARNDPNCCPSRFSDRRIHWTGSRFATTVRIRKA